MARTSAADSASAQYYINLVDNDFLDYDSRSNPDGYTVFAVITEGLDLADAIGDTPTFVCRAFSGRAETPQTATRFLSLTINRGYAHSVNFETETRTGC